VRLEAHGIEALPIDEASVPHLARLPALHRDPFDRLLVSQAIVHGLTIPSISGPSTCPHSSARSGPEITSSATG
jgi:PIN domain nuclease of toxin-antitoxin system